MDTYEKLDPIIEQYLWDNLGIKFHDPNKISIEVFSKPNRLLTEEIILIRIKQNLETVDDIHE